MWANVAPTVGQKVLVQSSAHGTAVLASVESVGGANLVLQFDVAQRRIAPGQSIVCYDETNNFVLGGGIADAVNPSNN